MALSMLKSVNLLQDTASRSLHNLT